MKYPISLDALEVLDAIARKGSFAAAANELYRVPSAITYTVQKLEQDLDVILFVKEGRKAVLTQTGNVLLEQGRELLAASERLAITVKKAHSGFEPVFNIAIDSLFTFEFIYPLIAEFYQLMPNIEINLYEEVLGGTLEAINTRRADLVISTSSDQLPNMGIKFQKIAEIDWVFTASPKHELAKATLPLTRQLIEQQRFIVVRDTARNQAPLSRRVFSKRPVLSVPTIAEKIQALCAGLGVGFLPAHRIQTQINQGQLMILPVNEASPPEASYLAWKASNKGKVLRWFVNRLSSIELIANSAINL